MAVGHWAWNAFLAEEMSWNVFDNIKWGPGSGGEKPAGGWWKNHNDIQITATRDWLAEWSSVKYGDIKIVIFFSLRESGSNKKKKKLSATFIRRSIMET